MRRWQEGDGAPSLALAEWEGILAGTTDQVVQILVDRSERATRLRQSSPFTGILTEPEYAAGREKDIEFNRELARHGVISKRKRRRLVPLMPVDAERKRLILSRIKVDFAAATPRTGLKPRHS